MGGRPLGSSAPASDTIGQLCRPARGFACRGTIHIRSSFFTSFLIQIQAFEAGETVYAVVRTGGKQHKVSVGDELNVELLAGAHGDSVSLPALLLVDGSSVTTDVAALAAVGVTAEIIGDVKGPKIRIHKFKNKTGQHTRQGHRQKYTRLRITGIDTAAKSEV
jgi:large subunit ribosomal protein L21